MKPQIFFAQRRHT